MPNVVVLCATCQVPRGWGVGACAGPGHVHVGVWETHEMWDRHTGTVDRKLESGGSYRVRSKVSVGMGV